VDREVTMYKAFVAAFSIAGLLTSTSALAVPISWHMTGEVTSGNEGSFFFPFKVDAGDPIAFDFSFESQTPCVTCDDTDRTYLNPLTAFSMTVGNTVFQMPLESSSIGLLNDHPTIGGDFIDALTVDFSGLSPSGIFFFGDLTVQRSAATVPVPGINDVDLANLLPPDSSLFQDPTLSFFDFGATQDRGYDSFGGRFQTSSVSSVPEPSTLLLLVSGALLVWLVRKSFAHLDNRRRSPSLLACFSTANSLHICAKSI
jgi:hypothetical protein